MANRSTITPEAGFTLTELAAGLLIASLVIAGIAGLTRRYADTMVDVRTAGLSLRSDRMVNGLLHQFERVDAGSIRVRSDAAEGRRGATLVSATLDMDGEGARLVWKSGAYVRHVDLGEPARFRLIGDRLLALETTSGEPLATVLLALTLPADCSYDTLTGACR